MIDEPKLRLTEKTNSLIENLSFEAARRIFARLQVDELDILAEEQGRGQYRIEDYRKSSNQ